MSIEVQNDLLYLSTYKINDTRDFVQVLNNQQHLNYYGKNNQPRLATLLNQNKTNCKIVQFMAELCLWPYNTDFKDSLDIFQYEIPMLTQNS